MSKTEQQRVQEKIDGFLKNYTDKRFYGWTPEMDSEYQQETKKEKKKIQDSYIGLGRVPLWCPKCKNIMNKKLDNKMYWLHNMCFDCVVELETQLRIEGKWEEYEKNKIKENIRSFIKETEEQVKEEKEKLDKKMSVVNVVNEDLATIEYENWTLNSEEVKMYKERMDSLLTEMHSDFEKTFGEKVHVEEIIGKTIDNASGE